MEARERQSETAREKSGSFEQFLHANAFFLPLPTLFLSPLFWFLFGSYSQ